MAYRKITETPKKETKGRPRGRPFKNKTEKSENEVMEISKKSIKTENNAECNVLNNLSELIMDASDEILKENLSKNELLENEQIDSINFSNGKNYLSIKLFKKQNRVFRVQMFLNDNIEIRNTTYSGVSTAFNFWNLLKGSLK